ncbi:MAG TPA: hypothetical protein VFQ31_02950, partial [Methyloceanibacter sp.]|nr:hypothetical protein [Methyloceanibacter sp.]
MALTLLVLRCIPFPAIARVTGLLAVCLILFSVEHFVGLGQLSWLYLPLMALSLFVIWSERAWFSDETFRTSEIARSRLEFVLGLTVPLALCCHAWIFPLQVALVGAWTLWDRRNSGHWHLLAPAAGGALGVFLLLPFLAGLGAGAGYMQAALVTSDARAPIVQFLIVWWPLLVLAFALPLAGQARSFAGFLTLLFLALLIFAEFFNAPDGLYRDDFIRFNPALKWWGWIFTGGVFSISAA